MKRLFILSFLIIPMLMGFPAHADFQKGLKAYDNKDYATALKEFTPLAKQGDADAQYILGVMYDKGQGVTQDYKAAVKWYRLAAEQGDASAQFNLGIMYANSQGVIQDYSRAHMWWNIAASQGHKAARRNRNVVERKMPPAQIAEAQRMAREWVEKRQK